MARTAKAIKPILGMVPPDPVFAQPARPDGPAQARQVLRRACPRRALPHRQADDAVLGRPARRMVRVRSAQGHQVRQRHHRHLPRSALARNRLRAAAPLHGRDRRRLPRLGLRQGRHRRRVGGDRPLRARARRRDPHRRAGATGDRQGRPRQRRGAREWRRAPGEGRDVGGRPEAQLPAVRRSEALPRRVHHGNQRTSASAARRARSTSRCRNCREFTCLPGEGPLHRGAISISPSMDYIERAYDDAKYGQFSRSRTST